MILYGSGNIGVGDRGDATPPNYSLETYEDRSLQSGNGRSERRLGAGAFD
jgi:hypothetical protein